MYKSTYKKAIFTFHKQTTNEYFFNYKKGVCYFKYWGVE